MTWDPTDKQGWKYALERPASPSSSSRPAKKVKLTTASDNQVVKPINEDSDAEKNIDTILVDLAVDTATSEQSTAAPGPMRSFFRPKKLYSLPTAVAEPTWSDIYTRDSSDTCAAALSQGDHALYDVLQSPYAQATNDFNQTSTSSGSSTSARCAHFNYIANTRSPPNEVEDITANFKTSASSSLSQPDLLDGTLVTGAFAKSRTLLDEVSNLSSNYQGFLFGNGGNDLDSGQKSDYFEKIRNNPYTKALQPHAPEPGIQVPQNATEARHLFKRGRYNQPRRDSAPQPTIEELQKVLHDLRKRFTRLKAMCDSAGIGTTGGIWDRTIAVVEGERPDIKQALDEDTGKGLKEYSNQLERWDKAVGHQAILMKRLNYKEQITTLERIINKAKTAAAVNGGQVGLGGEGNDTGMENGGEWKGHKTGLGRRFSGLIEKN